MTGSVFFRTLFEISSGPGALSGARRLTASLICRIVICISYGISCGCVAKGTSVRSAGGGFGKKAFRSAENALMEELGEFTQTLRRGIQPHALAQTQVNRKLRDRCKYAQIKAKLRCRCEIRCGCHEL